MGLGFREADFELAVTALSGGQRTAALCMLLQEPDVLLLDDRPTADLPAVGGWKASSVARARQCCSFRDRWFLDRVVSRVIEIDETRLCSYPGNYTAYARQREERLLRQQEQWERSQEQIAKLEEYIRRNHAGQLARQAKSREKMLARIQVEQPRLKRPDMKLELTAGLRSGDEVLRIEGLSKAFDEKTLFSGLELVIQRGERVGIVGPNGSGRRRCCAS